ncbi:polysaccharide pyruvyl transferase family protein [Geodermatophilus sp. SYSU D00703]
MRIIVVGDVGWPNMYHLGDEAMTEYAVDALRERGIDDICLVSADVPTAERTFGTSAVPRVNFRGKNGLAWREERLRDIEKAMNGDRSALSADDPARAVMAAVEGADAVLIAGGGNIASSFPAQLFERVAIGRMAEHYGKPFALTSQTFGPLFKSADRPRLERLLQSAVRVGTRERDSHQLVQEAGVAPGVAALTMDDAAWLEPRPADRDAVAALDLPARYVVGSFTTHAGTSGLSAARYTAALAADLDVIAERLDADVLLVPHLGTFVAGEKSHDQLTNDQIVAQSRSGRVRAMPLLPARQVIALTEGALLNLSTRYHPTVFGPAVGVPSVCLVLSYYSSVRMRGALGNVGLTDFALPQGSWQNGRLPAVVDEIVERDAELRAHLRAVREVRVPEGRAWWDALVAGLSGTPAPAGPTQLAEVPEFRGRGPWRDEAAAIRATEDRLQAQDVRRKWDVERAQWVARRAETQRDQAVAELETVRGELAALRAVEGEATKLRARNSRLQADLQRVRSRKAVRAADVVGGLVRRARSGSSASV